MERDLRLELKIDGDRLEIDILKILEQMGIDKEKWQEARKDPSEKRF